jgi:hypothetical protein
LTLLQRLPLRFSLIFSGLTQIAKSRQAGFILLSPGPRVPQADPSISSQAALSEQRVGNA